MLSIFDRFLSHVGLCMKKKSAEELILFQKVVCLWIGFPLHGLILSYYLTVVIFLCYLGREEVDEFLSKHPTFKIRDFIPLRSKVMNEKTKRERSVRKLVVTK